MTYDWRKAPSKVRRDAERAARKAARKAAVAEKRARKELERAERKRIAAERKADWRLYPSKIDRNPRRRAEAAVIKKLGVPFYKRPRIRVPRRVVVDVLRIAQQTKRDWAAGRPYVSVVERTATWRRLNAGLLVKHLPMFGLLPAAESEHIRPDLTAWAGTTLIQSDERSYA